MDTSSLLASVPALLAAAGILYCALALLAAGAFARSGRALPAEPSAAPSISILKPVKGVDPGLEADLLKALRSHCTQDYPGKVELLFAVHSLEDGAVPLLQALAGEFPAMRIEVVATPLVLGTNGKMSNLAQLLPHARGELLLISDADIAVGPRYLRRIVSPFTETPFAGALRGSKMTGLVTAPYRGRTHPAPRPTLGSRLEALGIAADFMPGVLTARLTDKGVRFALGSTLLISRAALAAAGGLEALTGVLADDYALGQRVAAAGYAVVLSRETVSTAVPGYTFRTFWQHQVRWARTVRGVRRWGYAGLLVTHPVPWALLYVAGSGGSLFSVVLLLIAVVSRMAVAVRIGYGVLGDVQVLRDLALLLLRDCLALAVWVWSYAGDTVEWRGERFRVHKGQLLRVREPIKE